MTGSTDSSAIWPVLREFSKDEPIYFEVSGRCMAPVINDGDRVAVRATRRYRPGDILLVRRHRAKPVVHRLIGVVPTSGGFRYLTRGDHEPLVDGSVPGSEILGRVVSCRGLPVTISFRERIRAAVRFLDFIRVRLTARHALR